MPHFPAFTINTLQRLPIWKFYTSPFDKILGIWCPEFVHVHGSKWNHKQQPRRFKTQNLFQILNYPFNYKNIAYKNIQPETCFGKLWGWMSQGCPHLALTQMFEKCAKAGNNSSYTSSQTLLASSLHNWLNVC